MKIFFYVLFICFSHFLINAQIIYVDKDATGNNDGTSWVNAYTELQPPLDAIVNPTTSIWVAEGEYLPTESVDGSPGTQRYYSFHSKNQNIAIYGGFNGTETTLGERDLTMNQTIFSGDFNGDDIVAGSGATLTITNNSENAYSVFVIVGAPNTTFDGVIIQGGNANSMSNYQYGGVLIITNSGGGIRHSSSSSSNPSYIYYATLRRCVIRWNSASYYGGGMQSVSTPSSIVMIINSTVSNNLAGNGGGFCSFTPHIKLINTTVNGNYTGTYGGGIYSFGSISLTRSTLYDNYASANGGAIWYSSHNQGPSNLLDIMNSTISGNSAGTYGNGIHTSGTLSINNVMVKGSIVSNGVNNISLYGSNPTFTSGGYNIFSNAPVGYSATDYTNVSVASLNLLPLDYYGGITKTMLPGPGSIAINNGDPSDYTDAQNRPVQGVREIGSAERYCQTPLMTNTVSACDVFTWIDGVTYTSSIAGVGYTKYSTVSGVCDSLFELDITINEATTGIDTHTACGSYTWINGVTYTSSNNTAKDTLINVAGCDSVVTLNLTIASPTTGVDNQVACGSYTWINGVTYTSSNNTAKDTLVNAVGCDSIVTLNLTIYPSLTVSSIQENITCNGGSDGSITTSVSGGTGGYIYSWSPSGGTSSIATGLSAGIYTCTITDASSCTTTISATIATPPVLSASISSQTNVSCSGYSNGTAIVSAGGGTGSLSYSWSPSGETSAMATGLATGTNVCTITDENSCVTKASVTITEPTVSVSSHTNVTCNGGTDGSATVSESGLTGPTSYSWLPSGSTSATATDLAAGTHTCTITDVNSCTITTSVTISEPSPITSTDIQVICDSPFYTWIDGITYTSNNNTATITLSNSMGCDSIVTLDLIIDSPPDVSTYVTGTIVSATAVAMLYQWIDCSTNSIIVGETNQHFYPSDNGSYAVIVSNGICSDTSNCIAINNLDIDELASTGLVKLYPNPANNYVVIEVLQSNNYSVELLDARGKVVLRDNFIGTKQTISTDNLNAGVYFVSLRGDNTFKTMRLIINR